MDEKQGSSFDEGVLRCILHSFKSQIEVNEIEKVFPNSRDYKVAIKDNSSCVTLRNLRPVSEKGKDRSTNFTDVEKFSWKRLANNELDNGFCVLDTPGNIYLYIKEKDEYNLSHVCNRETLQSILQESGLSATGTIESATWLEDCIILYMNGYLVTISIFERTFEFLYKINISELQNGEKIVPGYQIIPNYISVYQWREKYLLLFDITTGNLVVQVDLRDCLFPSNDMLTWKLSSDAVYFVLLMSDYVVYHLSIKEYINCFPSRLKSHNFKHQPFLATSCSRPFNTCYAGDTAWREKLHNMHSSQSNNQLKSASKSTKTPGICGFRKTCRDAEKCVLFKPKKVSLIEQGKTQLQGIVIASHHITLLFRGSQSHEWSFYFLDIERETYLLQSFSSDHFVVLCEDMTCGHLVLSKNHLMSLVLNDSIQQDELVNRLMLYSGATTTDIVCHMNQWGRCSIPLNTLEVGLRHRQLDTVSFFLKSKENLFSALKQKKQDVSTLLPNDSYYDNFVQIEPAINLLIDAIKENIVEQHLSLFASKLLNLTLEFLYGLLRDALTILREDDVNRKNLDKCVETIMNLIVSVRECMKKQSEVTVHEAEDSTEGSCEDIYQPPVEELIGERVNKSQMLSLQSHLYTMNQREIANLTSIKDICLKKAILSLYHSEEETAVSLLKNLGYNVADKLWEVATFSHNIKLRNIVIRTLRNMDMLNTQQKEMLNFIDELHKVYPCRSYNKAVEVLQRTNKRISSSETSHKEIVQWVESAEMDIFSDVDNAEEDSPLYCEVIFDWVKWWNEETRQKILLEGHLLQNEHVGKCTSTNEELIWEYLLSHNMIQELLEWIDYSFDLKYEDGGSELTHTMSLCDITLPRSYVDNPHLYTCTEYTRHLILKRFAKHGIFSNAVMEEFHRLLHYVSANGNLLENPHPLTGCTGIDLSEFHRNFLQYCAINNLIPMLWEYCDAHEISITFLDSCTENVCRTVQWFPFFIQMYCLSKNPKDADTMVQASLTNASLVLDKPVISSGDLIKNDHVIAALSTEMYSSSSITQITGEMQSLEGFGNISSSELENAVSKYPKLHATIFSGFSSEKPLQDINFYQLLKGNASFDTSRLFGWQTTNTTRTEDCIKEIPHFSKPDLVKQYSNTDSIKFTYYLKQGRPSYAVASFLAEECNAGQTTFTTQRAHLALNTALVMAAKYFNDTQKSCSAVVFVEMLGQDSLPVRLIINVGQTIYQQSMSVKGRPEGRKTHTQELEKELSELLLDCVYNKKTAALKVLGMLEDAICHNIYMDDMDLTSFESSQRWTLAVLFCHVMRIPLTKCYLEKCARADKWLQFLWFAQLHQYPSDQLQTILHNFRSHSLREHLHYVIENVQSRLLLTQSPIKKNTDTRTDSHDIRSSLYSRIGVAKDRETGGESSSEEEEIPAIQAEAIDEESLQEEDYTVNPETVPDDIFSIIFQCQSSASPWKHLLVHAVVLRNSLLAELSACYKDSMFIACLCGWLVAMMDEREHSKIHSLHSCWKWSFSDLEKLCDVYTQNNWGYTLATGFDIFVQGSPLIPFFKFAAEVKQRRNYKLCEEHLDKFKEEMNSFIYKKSSGTGDISLSLYGKLEWIESMVYRVLKYIVAQNGNVYDTLQILRLLDQTNISLLFSMEVPDFGKLHKITEIIHKNELSIDLSNMWNISSDEFSTECQKVIKSMLCKNLYSEAVSLAHLTSLSTDEITLDQLKFEQNKIQNTSLSKSKVVQRNFWNRCSQLFFENLVTARTSVDFFQKQMVNLEDYKEKAYLYSVMVECLTSYRDIGEMEPSLSSEFYLEMWLCKIKAKVQDMETTHVPDEPIDELFHVCENKIEDRHSPDKKELLHFGKMPICQNDETESTFTTMEQRALDILIKDLLKEGRISDSCRVAALFNHSCQDLAIILVCIRLSIGAMSIQEIDPDIRKLLTMESPKTTSMRKSHSVASFRQLFGGNMPRQSSSTVDFLPAEKEEIISTMESLLRHCNEGHQCCLRVITMYKIACILEVSYEDLVMGEEFTVLGALLKTSLPERFYLAKDFLSTGNQKDSVVAGYLSEEIMKTYKTWVESSSMNWDNSDLLREKTDLLFSPADKKTVFEQLVKLCKDPSILGDKLQESAAQFSGESEESQSELTIQTELLIMSHECHTIACNMEGISKVLRAARVCASCLTNAGEFALMVRLLTGIGRFSEMTYIFDALIQHHQFELLLKKGMEKEDKLKIAILDYLKRYHKSDSDTYTMVALNFTMHREIAQMLEECAQSNLNSLKKKTLDNSSETQATLKKIVQYYTDAAESYVKDNCIRHAQQCIRQARLVALQLNHLSPLIQVINLNGEAVKHVISCHTKFTEAFIISEAYGQRDCWPAALANNVINNGDMRYLQDFRTFIKITPVLISDTIDKYHTTSEKSSQSIQNVGKLLHLCKDIRTQLKIAQELQMRDFISTLMKGDAGKYLRDITHT